MRSTRSLARLCAAMSVVWLACGPALAEPLPQSEQRAAEVRPDGARPTTLAELKARLDAGDRRAALEALHLALTELGDGSSYVWGHTSRSLIGVIRPTMAFRDVHGRVCRHVVYTLSLGGYSKTIEGIACRGKDGLWSFG